MPRKQARPAAKKRQAKLAERIKSGKRPQRTRYASEPRGHPDMSMGLMGALLGVSAMDRLTRR